MRVDAGQAGRSTGQALVGVREGGRVCACGRDGGEQAQAQKRQTHSAAQSRASRPRFCEATAGTTRLALLAPIVSTVDRCGSHWPTSAPVGDGPRCEPQRLSAGVRCAACPQYSRLSPMDATLVMLQCFSHQMQHSRQSRSLQSPRVGIAKVRSLLLAEASAGNEASGQIITRVLDPSWPTMSSLSPTRAKIVSTCRIHSNLDIGTQQHHHRRRYTRFPRRGS